MPIKRTSGSRKRWHRHLAHEECSQCFRAAEHAKTDAIVEGLDWATFTVQPDHTVVVTTDKDWTP